MGTSHYNMNRTDNKHARDSTAMIQFEAKKDAYNFCVFACFVPKL